MPKYPKLLGAALALTTAGAIQSAPAIAQIAVVKGRCERLILSGRDLTHQCTSNLINTSWNKINRTGFYFVTADGLALTFSGIGHQQVKVSDDRAIQPIDMLIVGGDKFASVGSCDFSNPYKGVPAKVICSLTTERGEHFEGIFLTDGERPKVIRLGADPAPASPAPPTTPRP
jgi:hypothetical protein